MRSFLFRHTSRSSKPCRVYASSLLLQSSRRSHSLSAMDREGTPHVKDPITRVLFCGHSFPTSFNYTKECLDSHPNTEVVAISHEEVPDKICNYDLCVVRMMQIDSSVIDRAKRLKLLVQFGVGLEGVDIESATKAGIKVARLPGNTSGNALSCAEHAIYLILSLLRNQKGMEKAVQQMEAGLPIGQSLYGKTVLILGFGNIGKELAIRLRPFGVRVLATKRSWKHDNSEGLVDEKGTHNQRLDFARKADIVVTCCSLTPDTAGIINDEFVAALKKGSYIVNIARGGLLDYNAVKSGIENNHLGGLGMDVAWYEPFDPTNPLLQHSNVILTPHVAGVTELSYRNMAKIIANAALHIQAGKDFTSVEGLECVN